MSHPKLVFSLFWTFYVLFGFDYFYSLCFHDCRIVFVLLIVREPFQNFGNSLPMPLELSLESTGSRIYLPKWSLVKISQPIRDHFQDYLVGFCRLRLRNYDKVYKDFTKNHDLLLRSFAKLDISEARLMFVGDGELRETIIQRAQELGISNKIISSLKY
mgnify:CR=1 FL=1